jgi:hypothetical protein
MDEELIAVVAMTGAERNEMACGGEALVGKPLSGGEIGKVAGSPPK